MDTIQWLHIAVGERSDAEGILHQRAEGDSDLELSDEEEDEYQTVVGEDDDEEWEEESDETEWEAETEQ